MHLHVSREIFSIILEGQCCTTDHYNRSAMNDLCTVAHYLLDRYQVIPVEFIQVETFSALRWIGVT